MSSAIIIGAGIGGLSASIRLARAGWSVRILEQGARPGGKMGELRADGCRWDTGPSVVTMRHVIERLFREAGRDLRDYLDLVPLDPITRYFWPDGATIDAVQDPDSMCANIRSAGFDRRDIDGFRRFMAYARRLHDTVSGPFLYQARPGPRDLLRLPLADVLRIDALRTMHAAVRAHFHDPHLVQLFDRFATYNGSSPFKAPATLNVIAHVEMALGAWYPRGGVYQLARALAQLAAELGVEIHYGHAAGQIVVSGRGVQGVRANGRDLTADAVVCNADFAYAQQHLLDARSANPSRLEPSCSGFVVLAKSATHNTRLAHHNVFFDEPAAYAREFDDIFERHVPPGNPTLYLCITAKTDPDHAPPGCENWFVLANAPHLDARMDWQARKAGYAGELLSRLTKRIPGASATVIDVITPSDLQRAYNGNKGAIYGFSSNSRSAAFLRPGNRARAIRGLYYAGGSAHPGGGVPLVILSGLAAADCALEDQGSTGRAAA